MRFISELLGHPMWDEHENHQGKVCLLTLACACAAKGYCSLSGWLICWFVTLFLRTFSLEPWLLSIPNVDMWVCATGARHTKSLERRCPRTACLRRGPKIIYSYYTRCALIRDRQPTVGMTLHVQLRQKQRVSGK